MCGAMHVTKAKAGNPSENEKRPKVDFEMIREYVVLGWDVCVDFGERGQARC